MRTNFKEENERIFEKHRQEMKKNQEDYERKSKENIERMEKETAEFIEKNMYLMSEWRKYLYNYTLLLGGILSWIVALLSADIIKKKIDINGMVSDLKYIFFALTLSILAIAYSIYRDRANMWGGIYIKDLNHDNFDKKILLRNRIRKFFWVLAPKKFKDMEGMSEESKNFAKKEYGWKFSYFSDFRRRYADFRIFWYGYSLNSGVVWYGRIFSFLTISSITLGILGVYKLLIRLSQ